MKLDFNQPLVNLDGTPNNESNMGKLLANVLAQSTSGEPIKLWQMALKLYSGDILDLDTPDSQLLEDSIRSSQGLSIAGKAQLLLVIKNSKE